MSEESKVVYSFSKNALEEVRASITSFKGKKYLDIRIYYKTDDGDYKPSKKGITLSPALIDEIEEAVRRVKDAIKEEL